MRLRPTPPPAFRPTRKSRRRSPEWPAGRGSPYRWRLSRRSAVEVFSVLLVLAADLDADEHEDDVDEDADADEGGDQADVLGHGYVGEKHRWEPSNDRSAGVVAFRDRPPIEDRSITARAHGPCGGQASGEVPERLNGRDWKSRNGGNLVRGFESLPLRPGRR